MPLDPQVAALLAPAPEGFEMTSLPVDVLRKYVRESSTAYPKLDVPLASVFDRTIAGPGGALPIRTYTPVGREPFPILVYFHGGGFVLGNLDSHDIVCRSFCRGQDIVVVSVDYRLAPEHPYPFGDDDRDYIRGRLRDVEAAFGFTAFPGLAFEQIPARLLIHHFIEWWRTLEPQTPEQVEAHAQLPAAIRLLDTVSAWLEEKAQRS